MERRAKIFTISRRRPHHEDKIYGDDKLIKWRREREHNSCSAFTISGITTIVGYTIFKKVFHFQHFPLPNK
jgi:hypothetical protein